MMRGIAQHPGYTDYLDLSGLAAQAGAGTQNKLSDARSTGRSSRSAIPLPRILLGEYFRDQFLALVEAARRKTLKVTKCTDKDADIGHGLLSNSMD
ncbi:hypothetical protein HED48_22450 [Ochrobactrum intermedium]|nr:hypothetical protein [Brucella intermedia]